MNDTNGASHGIDEIDRATVSHVNSQENCGLVGHEAVVSGELRILPGRLRNGHDVTAVDLLSGEQRPLPHAELVPDRSMRGIESSQRFGLVVRNINPRYPPDEGAHAD